MLRPRINLLDFIQMLSVEIIAQLFRGGFTIFSKTCRFFRNIFRRDFSKHLRAEQLANTRNADEIMDVLRDISVGDDIDTGDVAIAQAAVENLTNSLVLRLNWRPNLEAMYEERRPALNFVCSIAKRFVVHASVVCVCLDYLLKFFLSAKRHSMKHRFLSAEFVTLVILTFEKHIENNVILTKLLALSVELVDCDNTFPSEDYQFPLEFFLTILKCSKRQLRTSTDDMRSYCVFLLQEGMKRDEFVCVLRDNDVIKFALDVAKMDSDDFYYHWNIFSILRMACDGRGRTNAIRMAISLGAIDYVVEISRRFSGDHRIPRDTNAFLVKLREHEDVSGT